MHPRTSPFFASYLKKTMCWWTHFGFQEQWEAKLQKPKRNASTCRFLDPGNVDYIFYWRGICSHFGTWDYKLSYKVRMVSLTSCARVSRCHYRRNKLTCTFYLQYIMSFTDLSGPWLYFPILSLAMEHWIELGAWSWLQSPAPSLPCGSELVFPKTHWHEI